MKEKKLFSKYNYTVHNAALKELTSICENDLDSLMAIAQSYEHKTPTIDWSDVIALRLYYIIFSQAIEKNLDQLRIHIKSNGKTALYDYDPILEQSFNAFHSIRNTFTNKDRIIDLFYRNQN